MIEYDGIKIGKCCDLYKSNDDKWYITDSYSVYDHAEVNAVEFNRLASYSPLFKRMVEFIMNMEVGTCSVTEWMEREQLLADIAELEQS